MSNCTCLDASVVVRFILTADRDSPFLSHWNPGTGRDEFSWRQLSYTTKSPTPCTDTSCTGICLTSRQPKRWM